MSVRLGAFASPAWIPRRPGAAAAALALNAALGAALILCFRMPSALDSTDAVATLIWVPEPVSPPARAKPRRSHTSRSAVSRDNANAAALSPIAPSVQPITSAPARAPVDWWKEAERVVKERRRASPALPDSRIDLHIEPQDDAPAHHAGESYRDELGARIVWVSDKCYIESDPPLPGTPPALASARVARTVCPGSSPAPREDVLKSLSTHGAFGSKVP